MSIKSDCVCFLVYIFLMHYFDSKKGNIGLYENHIEKVLVKTYMKLTTMYDRSNECR